MKAQSQQSGGQLPQKDLKQNATASSDRIDTALFVGGNTDHVTPRNILQLQRLIGNQRVQRLIPVQHAALQRSRQIQRAKKDSPTQEDKGLMEADAPVRFVEKIHAFTSDPQNANADIWALKDVMKTGLNDELTQTGVPVVDIEFMSSDEDGGAFARELWLVKIDALNLFGSTINHLSDLTEDQIKQAVSTVYHEGRHAEQFFRIAQLHVTDLLNSEVEQDVIKPQLVTELGLPENIIEAAIANPLDANTNRQVVKEIKLWDRSRFGVDSTYRDLVHYRIKADAITPLDKSLDAFLKLMPPTYIPLTDEQLEELKLALALIDEQQELVEKYQKNTIHVELDRIKAVDNPRLKASNDTMIRHLSKLLSLINGLRAHQPLPSEPYAAQVKVHDIKIGIIDIDAELDAAYYDLPLEADAFEAGEAIQKSMDKRPTTTEAS